MARLVLVLGDQLTRTLSSLADLDPERDLVLMAEVEEECRYVRHHKQKIALVLSAMRHFAAELEAEGIRLRYRRLDGPETEGSLVAALDAAWGGGGFDRVLVTEPGEWRLLRALRAWAEKAGVELEIRDDDRFFCSRARFRRWAEGRRSLRMEYFYREMRRESGLLMDASGEPAGGRWNFDSDNRRRLPAELDPPRAPGFEPDATTQEVIALVERRFPDHFGELDAFGWPVTRQEAQAALGNFVAHRLVAFGDYQDAMRQGAAALFHSLLSPALNIGLLTVRECCFAAERAFQEGRAPLNAVEGFVRQLLGWREYVRGIYWLKMPDYAEGNALAATRPLPAFYWTGETEMACLADVVARTRRHAYAHHIERLMVAGNFALLAGLEPRAVEYWYLVVFADAYEWVELPNTHGMALFADGGLLASKPYAASGKYIDRMSDFCRRCRYDPKESLGEGACPFNALYWNFLIENRVRLEGNPRMAMPYRTLDRFAADRRAALREQAQRFLAGLEAAEPGRW